MTATKRASRITATILLVLFLVSSMATFAMAAQQYGFATAKCTTYTVTKKYGTAIKITRDQKGVAVLTNGVTRGTYNFYGKYTIKVTDPKGKVSTYTWDSGKKSSLTLVGALKAKGNYKIAVYRPELGSYDNLLGVLSLAELKVGHSSWKWSKYPRFILKY